VARYPIGNANPLGPVVESAAPNTLSASAFITVSWSGTGATAYDVLKTPGTSLPASCTCLLAGAITGNTATDTGQVLTAYTVGGTGTASGEMAVNNRDYTAPRFTFTLPLGLLRGGITFVDGTTQTTAYTGGAVSGTVTSFSAGSAAPLFTTAVATATTTPALSFSLASALANLVFASPDGAPGAGSYRALVNADLPGAGATTVNGQACALGATCTVTAAATSLASSAFLGLGTPADGTVFHCTDCTVTSGVDNTCAALGTGALAVRLNGAWKCFQ
jgi:hypothetical protein